MATKFDLIDHMPRLGFWFSVWLGTTIAGGVFGGFIGLFALFLAPAPESIGSFFVCIPIGLAWAGTFGLISIPHIAIINWMFWLNASPRVLAILAGGVTGLFTFIPPITIPIGMFGAYAVSKLFISGELGESIREAESNRIKGAKPTSKSFTLADLFLRVTVIAILLSFWTAILTNA